MEFVTFETAKKLKEKGFREPCLSYYSSGGILYNNQVEARFERTVNYSEFFVCYNFYVDNNIDAPTISQILKWLRKEKKIHIEPVACAYGYNIIISKTPPDGTDLYFSHSNDDGPNDAGAWDVYEEALVAGIEYCLDNLI